MKPVRVRTRVVEAAASLQQLAARLGTLRCSIRFGHDVLLGKAHSSQRRRLQRERLRRRKLLAGNIALPDGALFHAEHWLPGFAVQNEHQAALARQRQRWNFSPGAKYIDEARSRW
jgi:hypothetical protein